MHRERAQSWWHRLRCIRLSGGDERARQKSNERQLRHESYFPHGCCSRSQSTLHATVRRGSRGLSENLHRLDVELDLDLIADEQATTFEHLVPLQPELTAVDRRRGREPHAVVAVRILGGAERLDVERHVARDT